MTRHSATLGLAFALACNPSSPEDGGIGGGKADDARSLEPCPYQSPMPVGEANFDDARELSGLAASRDHAGVLWTHNDGDEPVLYAFSREGDLLRTVTLPDSPAHDWEDLAIGPGPKPGRDYLYIADTGDNDLERRRVQVIRVLEPDPNGFDPPSPVEVFELEYGDGDPHDGEAMFVDPTDAHVYIVTKRTDHDDRKSKLFTSGGPLPAGGGDVRLEKLAGEKKAPHLDGVWVAADVSPGGDQIVLVPKKGDNLLFERRVDESILDALSGTPCAAPRSKGHQEAVAFSGVGGGYYMVPEGTRPTMTFAVEMLDCPEFEVTASVTLDSPSSIEISGVVASRRQPNTLWAVNDPGPESRNVVVALSREGLELGVVELAGAVNRDWEDIAIGPGPKSGRAFLYVADIGDNDAERDSVTVHRFEEPLLSALPSSIAADAIELIYDDGESRDAESVFVDSRGDLYVISRSRDKSEPTSMFVARAPHSLTTANTLSHVSELDLGTAISGADLAHDGDRLILRTRGATNIIGDRHPDQLISELLAGGCRGPGGSADHDSIALDGHGYIVISEDNPAEMLIVRPR